MSNRPSRRDRIRAATLTEIKQTARRVLVEQGAEGLSLRAIAREMGLTAPALYRYFPSREDLVEELTADLYDELSDTLERARDGEPDGDIGGRLLAVSRGFRAWALAHPREFGLVFGTLLAQLYLARPFPVPAEEEIDPALRGELADWCEGFPVPLPLGVAQVMMSCWIRIYGLVCMEVFGHLKFALMFGSPVPGVFTEGPEDEQSRMHHAGLRFGAVFGTLIAQLYQTHRFPVPADEEIDPVLRQQLAAWCTGFPIPLPLGVAQIFMSCWIRIYGLVCMEVFGHLDFALSDAEPMFETELRDLARLLDLAHEYRPPARRPSAIQGGPGRPPPE